MADDARRDLTEALGRGVIASTVGSIPVVGPMAAELLGTIIPNRRLDRLVQLLQRIAERVDTLDAARLRERFQSPLFVDLLEDGMGQAARAVTKERIDQIAQLLEKSLTREEIEAAKVKRLLHLLAQLSDVEIILLRYHGAETHNERGAIREQHSEVFGQPAAHSNMPLADIEDARFHESYYDHLVELRLLIPTFKKPARGANPEFDYNTGTIKAQGYRITILGRVLLRGIGLLPDLCEPSEADRP